MRTNTDESPEKTIIYREDRKEREENSKAL
jgi:hypothetical protein